MQENKLEVMIGSIRMDILLITADQNGLNVCLKHTPASSIQVCGSIAGL